MCTCISRAKILPSRCILRLIVNVLNHRYNILLQIYVMFSKKEAKIQLNEEAFSKVHDIQVDKTNQLDLVL